MSCRVSYSCKCCTAYYIITDRGSISLPVYDFNRVTKPWLCKSLKYFNTNLIFSSSSSIFSSSSSSIFSSIFYLCCDILCVIFYLCCDILCVIFYLCCDVLCV